MSDLATLHLGSAHFHFIEVKVDTVLGNIPTRLGDAKAKFSEILLPRNQRLFSTEIVALNMEKKS